MNGAEPDLQTLVCQELRDAGFAVAPSRKPSDGGLSVWYDPERGVVVRWSVPSGDPARHHTIRTAVRLALRTILGAAGFVVVEVAGRAELLVTAVACPPRQDGAAPGPTGR